ncbi:MAG: FAD-linked oxidase C-terminal domain-containing protein [Chloroflexota bacterium]
MVIERVTLARELQAIVGAENVLSQDYDIMTYSYDAGVDPGFGDAVVFPTSAEQVCALMRLANRVGMPIVPRGAGTGLSGGTVPDQGGIVVSTAKMNRILEVDVANRCAVVEPGLINLHLSEAVAADALYFAPDPSSQKSSTIGGNVAEKAGGPHTLLLGVTTNHVLGVEVALPGGDLVWFGGKASDVPGYDVRGLMVGSEGTLGIVTKAIVRLVPRPEAIKTFLAVFETVDDATATISAIIARGVIPAALEMMDAMAIQAIEQAWHCGYPEDAGAVLLIELEGLRESVEEPAGIITAVCRDNHSREVRVARDEHERKLLWAGRKGAAGALGRLSPNFYVMDGVVPRTRLPEVLRAVYAAGEKYGLQVVNLFHAGDGNLHPNFLFDSDRPGDLDKVRAAGAEISQVCLDVGGSLTGEHGIGVEKRDLIDRMFAPADLEVMRAVKRSFDPRRLCNPGKIFPTPGRCVELQGRPLAEMNW